MAASPPIGRRAEPSPVSPWRARVRAARSATVSLFVLPSRGTKGAAIVLTLASLVAAMVIVRATGGVRYAAVHAMYIPVIVAALVFAWAGGIVAGIVAGLLVGPRMPLDTTTGEHQQLANWLERMAFFCLIGMLVGVGVSMLRRRMMLLLWLNDHDPRTGLLTADGLVNRLDQQLAAAGPDRPRVIVAQINNLLDIENTFGPDFAADLLTHICQRARQLVPGEYAMALIQRDRVGVVLPGDGDARSIPAQIEERMRRPYDVDGVPVYVDLAFGEAAFPTHGTTAEQLIQKASIAMQLAVRRGLPTLTYDSTTDRSSRDNLVLLGMLPTALAHGELTVWHQAKVDLRSGAVIGTEALVRWNHPDRGLIPPSQFIPQVENSPLVNDLARYVVQAALADKVAWSARGHHIGVSVNLSVRNLHDGALFAVLGETVRTNGIATCDVDLEITESSVMHDFDYCAGVIGELRDLGYGVSIDDFGTGQSSLAYLKGLPVTTLKIDQSFVRNLATDDADRVIVRSIVDLAKALGLKCVAEGVEDDEAAALLRSFGCDYAQGYLFHRPCPYGELVAWLESGLTTTAAS